MKRIFIVLCVMMCFTVSAFDKVSQKKASLTLTVNNVIFSNDELEKIFKKYSMEIVNTNINFSRKQCEYEVYVKEGQLSPSLEEIEKIGSVDFKEIKSTNYDQNIDALNYDIAYLNGQKEIYGKELLTLNKTEKAYNDIFVKARELDKQIYEKNKQKNDIELLSDVSTVKIVISERTIQDLEDDEFSGFINMPGFETKYYRLENNDEEIFYKNYLGGSLRYMFTKGRSYFLIGILKPLEQNDDAKKVSDIVTYAVGKDFYPRYFGQGKNKFFNPYSGFEIGGMVLTSEDDIKHMFALEPHIGMEFFKNKYVIIDSRVGYIFPLDKEYIKSRRGLSANLSINFVF